MPWEKSVKDMVVKCFLLVVKIETSLVKQEILKHLCSRAACTSRNASTPADYFAHSSAPANGIGTLSSDGLLAAIWQYMKIQCKRWIHLNLRSYLEKTNKRLKKNQNQKTSWKRFAGFVSFSIMMILRMNTCL